MLRVYSGGATQVWQCLLLPSQLSRPDQDGVWMCIQQGQPYEKSLFQFVHCVACTSEDCRQEAMTRTSHASSAYATVPPWSVWDRATLECLGIGPLDISSNAHRQTQHRKRSTTSNSVQLTIEDGSLELTPRSSQTLTSLTTDI